MLDAAALADPVAELRRIIHNMDDHAEVLRELFTRGGLSAPFRSRLLDHIRYEESDNLRRLHALRELGGLPAHALEVLIQHSGLISGATGEDEQAAELLAELLHHFSEEHAWIMQTLGQPERPSDTRGTGLTVGSLLG